MPCKCKSCGYKYATTEIERCMKCGNQTFVEITDDELKPPNESDNSLIQDISIWIKDYLTRTGGLQLFILAIILLGLLFGFAYIFLFLA